MTYFPSNLRANPFMMGNKLLLEQVMRLFIENVRHISPEDAGSLFKILLGSVLGMLVSWGFLNWATGKTADGRWLAHLLEGGLAALIFCVICGGVYAGLRPRRQQVPVKRGE